MPFHFESSSVGCYDCSGSDSANIAEPVLAKLRGVTDAVTKQPANGLVLTANVTELDGDAVGGSVSAVCEVGQGDQPTNNYYVILPHSLTKQFSEGEWYYLWWDGDGIQVRVAFLARYHEQSCCR